MKQPSGVKCSPVKLTVDYVIEVEGVSHPIHEEFTVDPDSFEESQNNEVIEVRGEEGEVPFLYSHPERQLVLKGTFKGVAPSNIPPKVLERIREQGLPWYD